MKSLLEKPHAGKGIRQFVVLVTREIVELASRISSQQLPRDSIKLAHNCRVDALKTWKHFIRLLKQPKKLPVRINHTHIIFKKIT